jgi:hypothetical protein
MLRRLHWEASAPHWVVAPYAIMTATLLFALVGLSATLQFVSNHECIGEEKECP